MNSDIVNVLFETMDLQDIIVYGTMHKSSVQDVNNYLKSKQFQKRLDRMQLNELGRLLDNEKLMLLIYKHLLKRKYSCVRYTNHSSNTSNAIIINSNNKYLIERMASYVTAFYGEYTPDVFRQLNGLSALYENKMYTAEAECDHLTTSFSFGGYIVDKVFTPKEVDSFWPDDGNDVGNYNTLRMLVTEILSTKGYKFLKADVCP